MRKWIDLVETFGLEYEDDEEFNRQYGREPEPDDEFVAEVRSTLTHEHGVHADADEINSVAGEIRHAMNGGATIYRVMRLPDDFIDGLRPNESLGQHWSLDGDFSIDNLYDGSQYPDGTLYRFTAEAHLSDIDLAHSTAFNILFPDEAEVFLDHRNARLKLISVTREGSHENLRPDLAGQSFVA